MTELITRTEQLPDNIVDLKRYVDIGREQLTALRAELRAMDKVGEVGELREKELKRAQDFAETVLDAEVRIGELMMDVPKAQGFASAIRDTDVQNAKTKTQVIEESGFNVKQVQRFELLAMHPELVAEAKAEARENDDIVTRSAVLNKIKKPHVANNSGDNEWYTPQEYIDLAKEMMGSIDLDPASNDMANEVVQAKEYFTEEDNGLEHDWSGNVWLNPPYAQPLISQFCAKLINELPNISNAIVLVNNATETEWFKMLVSKMSAICFAYDRIKFYAPDGRIAQPLQGQAIFYFGDRKTEFVKLFSAKGWCAYPA